MEEMLKKNYRKNLGFTNQTKLRSFFDSKDIIRDVDYNYLEKLNHRLEEIIRSIHGAIVEDIKIDNLEEFIKENVYGVFNYMKTNKLLFRFQNNKQRQLERSYYDWSRGRVVANYFIKAMSLIFQVKESDIRTIGKDNLDEPDTFNKAGTADFEITKNNKKYRIEFQSGFQGINDIKEHKVLEARRVYKEKGIRSLIIHVDFFNGSVAFVDISDISDEDINWETRTQFEGKTVFHIDDSYFVWNLSSKPPLITELFKDTVE